MNKIILQYIHKIQPLQTREGLKEAFVFKVVHTVYV